MSWFERTGERAADPRMTAAPHNPRPSLPAPSAPILSALELPTEPLPVTVSAAGAQQPLRSKSPEPGYDPSQPNQRPVLGIDLMTFAVVSRQLLDTPQGEHAELLASYGQTPQSWRVVNTAWIARIGQMPFLCGAYRAALQAR